MRRIIFTWIWTGFVAAAWSCSETSSPVHTDSLSVDSAPKPAIAENDLTETKITITKDSFFLDTFMNMVDSFFTSYSGGKTGVNYTVREIQSDTSNTLHRSILSLPNEKCRVYDYFISGDENNPGMGFSLVVAIYPDSETVLKAWKHVVAMSGPPNADIGDKQPCISYTNDYLFRTGNRIFWLGTGCTWSYYHHMLIASLLKRSIHNCYVLAEIKCRCGGVRPVR